MAKILLVEDDNNLREIYEARLQAEGYNIMSAHDGEEALVIAKKDRPDIIISDVMMPRVSGFEMLDILRNTEGLRDVKVIMLTALGQAEDRSRAGSLGADRYLVKSQVTLEDIVKAAQELLSAAPVTPPEDTSAPGAATAPTPAPVPSTPPTATTSTPAAPATPPTTISAPAPQVKTIPVTVLASEPTVTPTPKPQTATTTTPAPAPAATTTSTKPATTTSEPAAPAPKPEAPKPSSTPAEIAKPAPQVEQKVVPEPTGNKLTKPEEKPAEVSKPTEPPKPVDKPAEPAKAGANLPLTAPRPDLPESEVMSDEERKKKLKEGLVLPGIDNSTAPAKPTVIGFGSEDDPAAQLASFVSINNRTAPEEDKPKVTEKPAEEPKTEEKKEAQPATPTTAATTEPPKPEEKPAEPAKVEAKPEEKATPEPEESGMSGAINDLLADANKQANEKSEPAKEEGEDKEEPPKIEAAPAPDTTKEKPAEEPQPAEKPEETESESDEDDDNVEVAHKKIIEPLSSSFATDDATDLNALLAKEGHTMDDTQGTEADDPTAMPHFASAHPPGLVFTPDTSGSTTAKPAEEK